MAADEIQRSSAVASARAGQGLGWGSTYADTDRVDARTRRLADRTVPEAEKEVHVLSNQFDQMVCFSHALATLETCFSHTTTATTTQPHTYTYNHTHAHMRSHTYTHTDTHTHTHTHTHTSLTSHRRSVVFSRCSPTTRIRA
jgi:hypothetical protein